MNEEYMQVAIDLSEKNLETKQGGPFGACIVKDGKIVGKGKNQVIKNNDPTAHAEIVAIRNACKNLETYDLTDCVLYTSCYPCPMCLSAIIWSNIKMVYYGNSRYDAERIGFRDEFIYDYINNLVDGNVDESILKLVSIDRDETIKVFEKYNNKNDKTIY